MENNQYLKLVESVLLERKKVKDDEEESKPKVHRKKEEKEIKLVSAQEIERLSKISAKYDTKKSLANKFFNKDYTGLNPKQKKRIRDEMKKPLIKKKIENLIDSKIKERTDKQKEAVEKQAKRKNKQVKKHKEDK